MVEARLCPIAGSVASGTIGTVPTLVYIVILMTAVAISSAEILEIASTVTTLTGKPLMPSIERECRHTEMVEGGCGPARSGVTVYALCSIAAFVDVIAAMTIDACVRDFRKDIA